MNGAAHIMNDEATRKYLQAVKRLLTFLQRAYPTDPSRSVDFDGFRDAGLGAKGAGSDKAVSSPVLRAPRVHDLAGLHTGCHLYCMLQSALHHFNTPGLATTVLHQVVTKPHLLDPALISGTQA